jgi:dTDP-glucose 4,6-dehydratase
MKLITGALGFIGSHLVDLYRLTGQGRDLVCLDLRTTYASNINYWTDLATENITYVDCDISDREQVKAVFDQYEIDTVFHLAAETHVDRSIQNYQPFIQANVMGTAHLLEFSVKHGVKKFVHVSTDEVYGEVLEGSSNELSLYHPRNPYSATKAASDHLVTAWHHTYGLNTTITHCSNNYGPRQYSEKMIPTIIDRLRNYQPVPIYGDGQQIRDWLFVVDHVQALQIVSERAEPGTVYNIGGSNQDITNLELVRILCDILSRNFESSVEFVQDRPGHDRRYSIDSSLIQKELGWQAQTDLRSGLIWTASNYGRAGFTID